VFSAPLRKTLYARSTRLRLSSRSRGGTPKRSFTVCLFFFSKTVYFRSRAQFFAPKSSSSSSSTLGRTRCRRRNYGQLSSKKRRTANCFLPTEDRLHHSRLVARRMSCLILLLSSPLSLLLRVLRMYTCVVLVHDIAQQQQKVHRRITPRLIKTPNICLTQNSKKELWIFFPRSGQ